MHQMCNTQREPAICYLFERRVSNGMNGQVVEVDPIAGRQLYARWIDANRAQTPPGAGDLFGIAMTPAGDGFYFVMDEVNMLALAK